MNKTEKLAYDWLKTTYGYKDEEILRGKKNEPDFICTDGKRFEVKLLYGNKLIFSKGQFNNFKDDDIIIVSDRANNLTKFLWKDRKETNFTIKILNGRHVVIPDKIVKELTEFDEEPKNAIKKLILEYQTIKNENLKLKKELDEFRQKNMERLKSNIKNEIGNKLGSIKGVYKIRDNFYLMETSIKEANQ